MKQILLMIIGLSVFLSAETTRFNRSTTGVVTDSKTALKWQDDYSSDGGDAYMEWTEAIDYCHGLSLDGLDWRLPNQKELLSIVDYSIFSPSISSTFQNRFSEDFWSSTTAPDTIFARYVNFYNGNTAGSASKTNILRVRCVSSEL